MYRSRLVVVRPINQLPGMWFLGIPCPRRAKRHGPKAWFDRLPLDMYDLYRYLITTLNDFTLTTLIN